jgi:formylmethanofuran dehydrogenase subunit A
MTSYGPARALGLTDRGHLGVGALADLRCYRRQADIKGMFSRPRWVMRRGRIVFQEGKLLDQTNGDLLIVRPNWDRDRMDQIYRALSETVSVPPGEYGLGENVKLIGSREVPCTSGMS